MSDWDTIVGFVFYVAPCTAMTIIVSGWAGFNDGWRAMGAIVTLIGCTLLFRSMQSPATSIDAALKEWAKTKAEIDAKYAEEEKNKPEEKEQRPIMHGYWFVIAVAFSLLLGFLLPSEVPAVLKYPVMIMIYLTVILFTPDKSKPGE